MSGRYEVWDHPWREIELDAGESRYPDDRIEQCPSLVSLLINQAIGAASRTLPMLEA